jgi:hypothetical protein
MVEVRVRGVYGTPWSKLAEGLTIDRKTLDTLGACLVKVLATEAKKDFAKRGWNGRAPHARDKVYPEGPGADGGPVIWESFSHQISGKSTLEILSTWWGLEGITQSGGVPSRKMTWITQEAKKSNPTNYRRTPSEIRSGKRGPLIVPIKKGGTVIFRSAPLTMDKAWIHPGIARFTFIERAVRKGRQQCADIIAAKIAETLATGDPTR